MNSCRSISGAGDCIVPKKAPQQHRDASPCQHHTHGTLLPHSIRYRFYRPYIKTACPLSAGMPSYSKSTLPCAPNIGGTGGLFFNTAQFPYVLLRKAGISRHQLVGLLLSKGIDEQKPIFAFFIKITGNVRVIDKDLHPFLGLLAYPILESVYLFFVDLHEDGGHLFKLPPATDIKSECIQRYRQKHEHQHKHVSHSILLKLISS